MDYIADFGLLPLYEIERSIGVFLFFLTAGILYLCRWLLANVQSKQARK